MVNASIFCNGGGGITLSLAKGVNIRATRHTVKCGSLTEKCIFLAFVCVCVFVCEDCRMEVLTMQVQR